MKGLVPIYAYLIPILLFQLTLKNFHILIVFLLKRKWNFFVIFRNYEVLLITRNYEVLLITRNYAYLKTPRNYEKVRNYDTS